jgi:hypothetical protein
LELLVLYPDLMGNLKAQKGDPNATSAVILLKAKGGRVLFPGDCGVDGWNVIHTDSGKKRIEIAVMTVPHHGGWLGNASPVPGKTVFQWLYEDVLHVAVGVVSVGTFNIHDHPLEECIKALRSTGTEVMCTQMTCRCSDDLMALGKGLISSSPYALSQLGPWRTNSGKNLKNVACAGTVVAEIDDDCIRLPSMAEHRKAVRSCPASHPLCV